MLFGKTVLHKTKMTQCYCNSSGNIAVNIITLLVKHKITFLLVKRKGKHIPGISIGTPRITWHKRSDKARRTIFASCQLLLFLIDYSKTLSKILSNNWLGGTFLSRFEVKRLIFAYCRGFSNR